VTDTSQRRHLSIKQSLWQTQVSVGTCQSNSHCDRHKSASAHVNQTFTVTDTSQRRHLSIKHSLWQTQVSVGTCQSSIHCVCCHTPS